jgi:hypothetical protein
VVPASTDYGYCSSFSIGNILTIVSIVADPDDARFLFTHIKNQIEIYYLELKEK